MGRRKRCVCGSLYAVWPSIIGSLVRVQPPEPNETRGWPETAGSLLFECPPPRPGAGAARRPRSWTAPGPFLRAMTAADHAVSPAPIGRTRKPARSPETDPASPNLHVHDRRYSGAVRMSVGDPPVTPGRSSTFAYRHGGRPQTFPTSPPSRFFKPIFTLSESVSNKA